MSPPIRAILFDLGDVLLRYDGHVVFEAIAALGPRFTAYQAFGSPHAWSFQERAEAGELDPAAKCAELNRIFGLQRLEADWAAAWAAGCLGPMPGMAALLDRLQPRYTLGCLSNTVPWHWAAGLRQVPALRRMQHLFVSFELRCRKPGARIYQLALEALELPARQVLFVDDRPENVTGAEAVGMRALRFRDCARLEAELEGLGLL